MRDLVIDAHAFERFDLIHQRAHLRRDGHEQRRGEIRLFRHELRQATGRQARHEGGADGFRAHLVWRARQRRRLGEALAARADVNHGFGPGGRHARQLHPAFDDDKARPRGLTLSAERLADATGFEPQTIDHALERLWREPAK
jgi:hypothetical protein